MSGSAVGGILAAPLHDPVAAARRREERLRDRRQVDVRPQIHDKEAIVWASRVKTDDERVCGQHCAIDPRLRARPDARVLAADAQEITVQSQTDAVRALLAPVEDTCVECLRVVRLHRGFIFGARELVDELTPPLGDAGAEIALMIGKEEKRRRGAKFLPLEKERRRG